MISHSVNLHEFKPSVSSNPENIDNSLNKEKITYTNSKEELTEVFSADEIKKIETDIIEIKSAIELYKLSAYYINQEKKMFDHSELEIKKNKVLIRTLLRMAHEKAPTNLTILSGLVIELICYSDKKPCWNEGLNLVKKGLAIKEIAKYPGRKAEFHFAAFNGYYRAENISEVIFHREEVLKLSKLNLVDIRKLNPSLSYEERKHELFVIKEYENRLVGIDNFLKLELKEEKKETKIKKNRKKRQRQSQHKKIKADSLSREDKDAESDYAAMWDAHLFLELNNLELKNILIKIQSDVDNRSAQTANQEKLLIYCSQYLETQAKNFETLIRELIELSNIRPLQTLKNKLKEAKKSDKLILFNSIANQQALLSPIAHQAQIILAALHLWGCGVIKDADKASEFLQFDAYGVIQAYNRYSIRNWLKSCINEYRFACHATKLELSPKRYNEIKNNKKELQKFSLFCILQQHIQEETEQLTSSINQTRK